MVVRPDGVAEPELLLACRAFNFSGSQVLGSFLSISVGVGDVASLWVRGSAPVPPEIGNNFSAITGHEVTPSCAFLGGPVQPDYPTSARKWTIDGENSVLPSIDVSGQSDKEVLPSLSSSPQ